MSAQPLKLLPTLYKKSSTEADQEWTIGTQGNVIITRWGQVGGATQETKDEVKTGKNVGRSNETTAVQQAELEAKSKWEKKLKKGYVKNLEDAQAGKIDSIIEGGIFPMLAHKFAEQGHKLKYPCRIQPKLDGHRCIGTTDKNGKASLWSRTRKRITSMTHIEKAIEALGLPNLFLDGELYNHAFHNRFEELSSFIRNSEFQPGAEQLEYHIYDLPSAWGFGQRWDFLVKHLSSAPLPLRLVETYSVQDEDDLMNGFNHYLSQGYEGAMARNIDGAYVNKRSTNLLKIKEFDDGEFEVIGVEEGRGKLAGHAIFVCKAANGNLFGAKLKGKQEELKQYFDNPGLAVGRQLTVKYQGLTNKKKVPRFPVAWRFREDL